MYVGGAHEKKVGNHCLNKSEESLRYLEETRDITGVFFSGETSDKQETSATFSICSLFSLTAGLEETSETSIFHL